MKPPCIIVANYLLPAIRASVARELVEKRGLTPATAANRLGITPAAVTQYLNRTRGSQLEKIAATSPLNKALGELASELEREEVKVERVMLKLAGVCALAHSEEAIQSLYREKGVEPWIPGCPFTIPQTSTATGSRPRRKRRGGGRVEG